MPALLKHKGLNVKGLLKAVRSNEQAPLISNEGKLQVHEALSHFQIGIHAFLFIVTNVVNTYFLGMVCEWEVQGICPIRRVWKAFQQELLHCALYISWR